MTGSCEVDTINTATIIKDYPRRANQKKDD